MLEVPLATTGELVCREALLQRFHRWMEQLSSCKPLTGHAEREFAQRQLAHLCLHLGANYANAHVVDSPRHLRQVYPQPSKKSPRSGYNWKSALDTLNARCQASTTPTQRIAWQWLITAPKIPDPKTWEHPLVWADYVTKMPIHPIRSLTGSPAYEVFDFTNPFVTAFYSRFVLGTTAYSSILALLLQGISFICIPPCLILARNPSGIHRDSRARPHSLEGPAIRYHDGSGANCIHGTLVPDGILPFQDDFSILHILAQEDLEVRRELIEHVGIETFLNACKAQPIATDDFGTLYHIHIDQLPDAPPKSRGKKRPPIHSSLHIDIRSTHFDGSERIAYVRLLNSTPEPGTTDVFKEYLLQVPPTCLTPQEAVAWSFNIPPENYHPLRQT